MRKRILILGNNDESTDFETSAIAKFEKSKNHGIVESPNFEPAEFGYYHTSIADLSFGEIVKLAPKFDCVQLLDQPMKQWSHHRIFLQSYKIMLAIDDLGVETKYRDNKNVSHLLFFEDLVKTNKSFCIFPWIAIHPKFGKYYPCSRFNPKLSIKKVEDITDFKNDPDLVDLRQKMLRGEKIDGCGICYAYEDKGMESYRQFETKDWISQIGITTLQQIQEIESPYYYEIFINNTCNLMCRSCNPFWSHLIAQEEIDNGLIASDRRGKTVRHTLASTDLIDIKNLKKQSRVYLHGGEPTIIPEVYTFLQKCIDADRTDFQLAFCTNGQKLSKKFLHLLSHFTNTHLSFSIDGYGKINDYWRHGSNWEKVIDNIKKVKSMGCKVSFNTVPGIYNITNLHLLLEFADEHFPDSTFYMQINDEDTQDVYNHPNVDLVLESVKRCMKTNVYHSDGKSNKSFIDSVYEYYSSNPQFDKDKLRKFFQTNDKLDSIRNIRLKDYIPELEDCRRFIQ